MSTIKHKTLGDVELLTNKAGWVTFIAADGAQKKARSSQFEGLPAVRKSAAKSKAAKSHKGGKTAKAPGDNVRIIGEKGKADLSRYVRGAAETVAGNQTIDIDDPVAKSLRGLPVEKVYTEAARALKKAALEEGTIEEIAKGLVRRYGKLNLGMQRMNLGNRIRGALRALEG